ncbi:PREDICTED: ATP synthase subunit g, mitochondrial-like [Lipotes vexillifer]|uniref:ATP synthase subunit g, mitochondrial-like n=1 Tax=Lipotes vexillifer TaxID=118797 RepID=A0A340WRV4_LIPVE|nr:PREDICTED: ATP synthase subunit g, mitochondrial-like [Lipotes vexillifer]
MRCLIGGVSQTSYGGVLEEGPPAPVTQVFLIPGLLSLLRLTSRVSDPSRRVCVMTNKKERCHLAGQSAQRAFRPRTVVQFVRNLAERAPVLVNAAVTYLKPRLATFWHYAKVGLVPPTPAEIPTAIHSLKKIINSAQTGSFKQLTVKEALLNGLVATEVWMWFYVGEIIGKHGIIDYNV